MRKFRLRFAALLITLLCLLPLSGWSSSKDEGLTKIDRKRNQLIGYILSRQLPALHFSDKELDDELSEAAFYLYIKQLDFQKRFLLKSDVEQLRAFAPFIDSNLKRGRVTLPDAGFDILGEKIDLVEKVVDDYLSDDTVRVVGANEVWVGKFQLKMHEMYETDPEKIDFAEDFTALKDRWRKSLKAQLVSRFLELKDGREKQLEQEKNEGKKATIETDEELWKEVVAKIKKRNTAFFQRLKKETLQDHFDRFFNCVTRAFDPHTNYIPPAGKEQFDISMRGSLEGIGALLREDDGLIKVVRIIPGSGSARQGDLKAEDIILQVAQDGEEPVDISDMRLRDAVRLIRGPKGEPVHLTVKKPDGDVQHISIVRDVVQIEETFVKSTVYKSKDGRKTGYIYIPSFYRDFSGTRNGGSGRNSTKDTEKELKKLIAQGVDGIVLDLRDDGGGALVDAVDIAGLFIKSGPIVQVKNSFGDTRVLRDKDEAIEYDGPLVVLVNQFSASASEIVAAALQDYRRAVVVGTEHTHGKGTVQTIVDLDENIPLFTLRSFDNLGALKVMIQKFYRVTGSSTQYKGVEPDIILPNLFAHIKSGERYLDYSLPWDAIDPIAYTPWKKRSLKLDILKKNSKKRIAHDEGMKIISEEAARSLERSKKTSISLHFDDMRGKRLEAEKMREKVGEHYRKYREERDEDGEIDRSKDDQADPHEVWLKNVHEDPYIEEAVNVVGDIIRYKVL